MGSFLLDFDVSFELLSYFGMSFSMVIQVQHVTKSALLLIISLGLDMPFKKYAYFNMPF